MDGYYIECIDTGSRFIKWAVYHKGWLLDVFDTQPEAEAFIEGQDDESDSDRV